jgi:glycosyltransferase involved in cell wall biosynthesis
MPISSSVSDPKVAWAPIVAPGFLRWFELTFSPENRPVNMLQARGASLHTLNKRSRALRKMRSSGVMPHAMQRTPPRAIPPSGPRALAVLCDLREENWPSMDLVADKLLLNLSSNHAMTLRATRVCPPMKVRFGQLSVLSKHRLALNADRLLNRMLDYPNHVSKLASDYELFHICDHSYAQLAHSLPQGTVGIFCHDLDTFRCLLDPRAEPRSQLFKAMARRVLGGLQKASLVFHSTSTVRNQIERYGLMDTARLVHAPYGIAEEFCVSDDEESSATTLDILRQLDGAPFLLHVGSCIPRKRVDVLLEVFAGVRRLRSDLRLVQVGGEWSAQQRAIILRHDLHASAVQLPRMSQRQIAELYRRAALVLMPSEAEGFGLPVVEALACGSVVVTSDIPVFREVGGSAVVYCPMGEVGQWVEGIDRLLTNPALAPELEARLAWTQQFSWAEHARRIAVAYRDHLCV